MDDEQKTAESRDSILEPDKQYAIIRQLLDRQDEVLQRLDELDARVLDAIEQCAKSRLGNVEESSKAA